MQPQTLDWQWQSGQAPAFIPPEVKYLDGTIVPVAATALYLGTLFRADGAPQAGMSARLGQATAAFNKLGNIWNSRLPNALKVRIFHSIFIPMALYSTPHTAFNVSMTKKLDAWYMRQLRRVLRVKDSFYSHVPHSNVLLRPGSPPLLSHRLHSQQLQFYGKVLNASVDSPISHCCLTNAWFDKLATGNRRVGRPRQIWLDYMMKVCQLYCPPSYRHFAGDHSNIRKFAQQPKVWESIVKAPTRPRP